MSHIVTVDLEITDLKSLEIAAKKIGLEFVRDSKKYKWYGVSVGDYPLPKGFNTSDLGKCEHEIRVPDNNSAYSIGVVPRRDGKAGYTLMYDFYNGGYGLMKVAGSKCSELLMRYTAEVTIKEMRKKGFRSTVKRKSDGTLQVIARR